MGFFFIQCGEARSFSQKRGIPWVYDPATTDGCGRKMFFPFALAWKNMYEDASYSKTLEFGNLILPSYGQRLCPACVAKFLTRHEQKKQEAAARRAQQEREFQETINRGCGMCGGPLKKSGVSVGWWDFDQVDWRCGKCNKLFCGSCSTNNLQKLKSKYNASGPALKRAIESDQNALYLEHELAPFCPGCNTNLHRKGKVL
jgi:hypothetical protein